MGRNCPKVKSADASHLAEGGRDRQHGAPALHVAERPCALNGPTALLVGGLQASPTILNNVDAVSHVMSHVKSADSENCFPT